MIDGSERTRSLEPYIALSVLFLLIAFGDLGAQANPTSREPLHIDNAGGGPLSEQNMVLRFVSENVTVILEEDLAHVEANYSFQNTGNLSLEQIVLLPFYEKPWNIDLRIEGETIDFSWDTFNLFKHGLDYYTNEELSALNFTITLEPGENCTLNITYDRHYLISPEKVLRRNFIYLARTGSLWNDPIEYARFMFLVNETMVKDGFEGIPDFNGVSPYPMDKERVRELVDFLYEEVSREEGYILLERTYINWVPETDVGVAWDLYRPVNIIDDSIKFLTDKVQIIFNGSLSYDVDGSIVNYTWEIDGKTFNGKEFTFDLEKFGFYHIALETMDDSGLKESQGWDYLILPEDDMFTLNLTDLLQVRGMLGSYDSMEWGSRLWDIRWKMGDGTIWEGRDVEIDTGKGGRSEIKVYYKDDQWSEKTLAVEVLTIDAELDMPERDKDMVENDRSFSPLVMIGIGVAILILLIVIVLGTILLIKGKFGQRMKRTSKSE